jgi:hypothetical protein
MIGNVPVAEIGLGCMNINHAYGPPLAVEQATALLHRAVELGVEHFDTAALYAFGANEQIVGEALAPYRQQIFLASKCGITGVNGRRVIDGRPSILRQTCHDALQRLRTDVIDLYYLHRWDKSVPIEDSVGTLGDLVKAGHIRMVGLSEVSVSTLMRAHRVHPIAAVQNEYSLWSRNPEIGILAACRDIGAAFVAFSPVARGFLADAVPDPDLLSPQDLRRQMPRFQSENFRHNSSLLPAYRELARQAGCSPAQLALAWLLNKDVHIVPIVGTTSCAHLEENLGAADLRLSLEVIQSVDALINQHTVLGPRYPVSAMLETDSEEFPAA